MAIVAYSQQNEFDLVNTGQDCRGWTVMDQAGNPLGTVAELLIDTQKEMIDSIIVDSGARIPARDIALQNGQVTVRGVVHDEQYEQTRRAAAPQNAVSPLANAAPPTSFAPDSTEMRHEPVMSDKATFVPGVTREANEDETVVPIVEERLQVSKKLVEGGGVRVHTGIVETPVEQTVNLRQENVIVERRPVNRQATEADFQTFKNGEIILTERAEVPIVSKEARVVEEIVIGKEIVEHEEIVRETIRKTDVNVEQFGAEGNLDNETQIRRANS